MTSNWLSERDVLKEQVADLQTRNDNLQTSLVDRDETIEKLVRCYFCYDNVAIVQLEVSFVQTYVILAQSMFSLILRGLNYHPYLPVMLAIKASHSALLSEKG